MTAQASLSEVSVCVLPYDALGVAVISFHLSTSSSAVQVPCRAVSGAKRRIHLKPIALFFIR